MVIISHIDHPDAQYPEGEGGQGRVPGHGVSSVSRELPGQLLRVRGPQPSSAGQGPLLSSRLVTPVILKSEGER